VMPNSVYEAAERGNRPKDIVTDFRMRLDNVELFL